MGNARRVRFRKFFEQAEYVGWNWDKKSREQMKAMHQIAFGSEQQAEKFVNDFVIAKVEAGYGNS